MYDATGAAGEGDKTETSILTSSPSKAKEHVEDVKEAALEAKEKASVGPTEAERRAKKRKVRATLSEWCSCNVRGTLERDVTHSSPCVVSDIRLPTLNRKLRFFLRRNARSACGHRTRNTPRATRTGRGWSALHTKHGWHYCLPCTCIF